MRAFASVLLPEPFGPITAWTSPLFSARETPFRISRPSTLARRSLISKSANSLSLVRSDLIRAAGVTRANPGRALHLGPQQAPVEVELVLAGVAGSRGDVLDRTVAVPELQTTVRPLGHLGHVALLVGETSQLASPLLEVLARRAGGVLGLHAACPLREEALHLAGLHEVDELDR